MKHTIVDDVCVVTLQGDVVTSSVQTLKKLFMEILNSVEDVKILEVKMNEVNEIDSQGLNFFIGLQIECEKRKLKLQLVECNSNVGKIFAVFKLNNLFGIKESK